MCFDATWTKASLISPLARNWSTCRPTRSVRDLLDGTSGALVRLDYTPYGAVVRDYGNASTDYRYVGLFYHAASSLNLATYRVLDGVTGRFVNRDPIRETGGINLFAYVGASPVNGIDTLGLENCMGGGYCAPFPPSTPPTWSDVANTIDILMWLPIGPGPELKVAKICEEATEEVITVIGRTRELNNLQNGERSLLGRLPDKGNPRDNWHQNSGELRKEMNRGNPIGDKSPSDTGGQFLNAERNLLRDRGWTFDPKTNRWMPPKPCACNK